MITVEFKVKAKQHQLERIDEAIRTGQFIRPLQKYSNLVCD